MAETSVKISIFLQDCYNPIAHGYFEVCFWVAIGVWEWGNYLSSTAGGDHVDWAVLSCHLNTVSIMRNCHTLEHPLLHMLTNLSVAVIMLCKFVFYSRHKRHSMILWYCFVINLIIQARTVSAEIPSSSSSTTSLLLKRYNNTLWGPSKLMLHKSYSVNYSLGICLLSSFMSYLTLNTPGWKFTTWTHGNLKLFLVSWVR